MCVMLRGFSLWGLMGVALVACGGLLPEPPDVLENRLVSTQGFEVGDWPGTEEIRFKAFAVDDHGELTPSDLCGDAELDGERWVCSIGGQIGVISVVDARIDEPGLDDLRVFLELEDLGVDREAFVSPAGHLIAELALYFVERGAWPLGEALKEAQSQFSPLVFDVENPNVSPAENISAMLRTDGLRQAFWIAAFTRVAANRYAAIPVFHRTRFITGALGGMLRRYGELRDVAIHTAQGEVIVHREALRHELALEAMDLALELEVPPEETRFLAMRINAQSGRLFGFTRAPPLP